MSRERWTKEDEQLLLQFEAEDKSVEYCMEYFNRSRFAIESKRDKLHKKFNYPSKKYGYNEKPKKSNTLWTAQELILLEQLVDEGKQRKEIADILNRSEQAIEVKVNRMGKKLLRDCREWTNDEDKRLSQLWLDTSLSNKEIAKELNRSWYGVRKRSQVLCLGERPHKEEYITVPEICECMQVSGDRVYNWLKIGLKHKKNKSGKAKYLIDVDKLLVFLEKHQDYFRADLVSPYLFAIEPEWFTTKRKEDARLNSAKRRVPWSEYDESRLKRLVERGKTDEEIAIELNRTVSGVACRRHKLGISQTIYSEKEINILKENSRYCTIQELQEMLPRRSAKSIMYKCESLGIPYHHVKNKCEER